MSNLSASPYMQSPGQCLSWFSRAHSKLRSTSSSRHRTAIAFYLFIFVCLFGGRELDSSPGSRGLSPAVGQVSSHFKAPLEPEGCLPGNIRCHRGGGRPSSSPHRPLRRRLEWLVTWRPPPPGASSPEGAAVHFVTSFRKSEAISSACVLVTASGVLGSTRLQGGGQLSSTSWRERGQGAWERILKSPSSPLTFRT